MKWLKHLHTINKHKITVMKHCFKAGIYFQGIAHDLSKYTLTEFKTGAKYYQGHRSPNTAEREELGYSPAWLHHKGRNKHHLEYWIDYGSGKDKSMQAMKMPDKYVIEMFCDRVAASKIYRGSKYEDRDSLDYYEHGKNHYMIHDDTRHKLEKLLLMLKEQGENVTFAYIKKHRKTGI